MKQWSLILVAAALGAAGARPQGPPALDRGYLPPERPGAGGRSGRPSGSGGGPGGGRDADNALAPDAFRGAGDALPPFLADVDSFRRDSQVELAGEEPLGGERTGPEEATPPSAYNAPPSRLQDGGGRRPDLEYLPPLGDDGRPPAGAGPGADGPRRPGAPPSGGRPPAPANEVDGFGDGPADSGGDDRRPGSRRPADRPDPDANVPSTDLEGPYKYDRPASGLPGYPSAPGARRPGSSNRDRGSNDRRPGGSGYPSDAPDSGSPEFPSGGSNRRPDYDDAAYPSPGSNRPRAGSAPGRRPGENEDSYGGNGEFPSHSQEGGRPTYGPGSNNRRPNDRPSSGYPSGPQDAPDSDVPSGNRRPGDDRPTQGGSEIEDLGGRPGQPGSYPDVSAPSTPRPGGRPIAGEPQGYNYDRPSTPFGGTDSGPQSGNRPSTDGNSGYPGNDYNNVEPSGPGSYDNAPGSSRNPSSTNRPGFNAPGTKPDNDDRRPNEEPFYPQQFGATPAGESSQGYNYNRPPSSFDDSGSSGLGQPRPGSSRPRPSDRPGSSGPVRPDSDASDSGSRLSYPGSTPDDRGASSEQQYGGSPGDGPGKSPEYGNERPGSFSGTSPASPEYSVSFPFDGRPGDNGIPGSESGSGGPGISESADARRPGGSPTSYNRGDAASSSGSGRPSGLDGSRNPSPIGATNTGSGGSAELDEPYKYDIPSETLELQEGTPSGNKPTSSYGSDYQEPFGNEAPQSPGRSPDASSGSAPSRPYGPGTSLASDGSRPSARPAVDAPPGDDGSRGSGGYQGGGNREDLDSSSRPYGSSPDFTQQLDDEYNKSPLNSVSSSDRFPGSQQGASGGSDAYPSSQRGSPARPDASESGAAGFPPSQNRPTDYNNQRQPGSGSPDGGAFSNQQGPGAYQGPGASAQRPSGASRRPSGQLGDGQAPPAGGDGGGGAQPQRQQQPQQPSQPQPRPGSAVGGDGDVTYEEAKYEFQYRVEHPPLAVDFGHHERRVQQQAQGEYFVLLPDGRTQVVEYEADEGGYKPVVRYGDRPPAIFGAPSASGPRPPSAFGLKFG